ncbi:MAG TPA: glycoside hydrolase family 3 C-terminal domain-containing protein [Bacteroidales bacterium]|nr:glycoside hydrolase family 3 C-terminal domain-containing protein [Bacteroidales bacterium]
MKVSSVFNFFIFIFLTLSCAQSQQRTSYVDITNPADERKIDSIIKLLTIEEKVNMLCGNGLFTSAGIERLGINDLHYTDGPFGIREELGKKSWAPLRLTTDSATFFPTGSALAATWNPDMAYAYGVAMGEEARTRGKDVLLGPAVNITRTPLNGRTYEYMSEDPWLNSRLAVGYVKGVQSTGVASCVKHFAVNNQETNRGRVNVLIDERALQEIYLPAFKASVTEGGSYSVMAAYNKLRGDYCAENDYLLNKVLRDEWNFKGMVISDWGGTHSTVKSALNGLDIEMGTERYFNKPLLDSVKKGLVPEEVINEKVKRILRVCLFTSRKPKVTDSLVSTPEHNRVAYDVAAQSIVLLKNTKEILPLDPAKLKSIAVIGETAVSKNALGGFGAGVKARYEITPLEGLKDRLGPDVKINYVQGYQSKFVRRFVPDNTPNEKLLAEAVNAASKADMTILFVGNNREVETESFDRLSMNLPFGQDSLIKAVCMANRNTIVVVVAGAPVDMRTAEATASTILWSWFNGSQAGYALADVILGKVNPSGRLPFTIPEKLADSPAHALGAFPGNDSLRYSEGILVGYRWFDNKNISPLYPFGFGLSYTNFNYNNLKVENQKAGKNDTIRVSLKIKNTGKMDGFETAQIYVSHNDATVLQPVRELKAFKKVPVPKNTEVTVSFKIPVSQLAWYNEAGHRWFVSPGKYQIAAGSSSRDIRKVTEIEIK